MKEGLGQSFLGSRRIPTRGRQKGPEELSRLLQLDKAAFHALLA